MGLLDRFRRRRRPPGRARQGRAYDAARRDRLFAAWVATGLTADAELRTSLPLIRARSRELAQNADYARRFLKLLRSNVVGPRGIVLQVRARDERTGEFDKDANKRIEERWKAWSRKKICTVDGRFSWQEVQRVVLESLARDGEILVRKVRGFPNGHDFALQLLEADHLDETHFDRLSSGSEIRMGIEVDRWGRPQAYHLRVRHPGDDMPAGGIRLREYERIPADEMVHGLLPERPTQSRGVPWMHTAMTRLNMGSGYEEAELVAARVGAAKMGFYKTETGEEYTGDDTDEKNNVIQEAEPGAFEELPRGWSVETFNPDHPSTAFGDFQKAVLRGVASGLNVSYHALASDLSGVNYSSARVGELTDREYWKELQGWFVENLLQDVYEDWLTVQIDAGHLPLPARKLETFLAAARWQPRGWAWVDPEKESEGNRKAYALGTKSLTEIAAEQGRDLEETFEQIAAERKLAEKLGIVIDASGGSAPAREPAAAAQED